MLGLNQRPLPCEAELKGRIEFPAFAFSCFFILLEEITLLAYFLICRLIPLSTSQFTSHSCKANDYARPDRKLQTYRFLMVDPGRYRTADLYRVKVWQGKSNYYTIFPFLAFSYSYG